MNQFPKPIFLLSLLMLLLLNGCASTSKTNDLSGEPKTESVLSAEVITDTPKTAQQQSNLFLEAQSCTGRVTYQAEQRGDEVRRYLTCVWEEKQNDKWRYARPE